MKSKYFALFIIGLASFSVSFAAVRLPALFGDHMVLQQNADAPFWGWSEPNATITISCSWDQELHITKADRWAKWKTSIKTPPAGGPFTITISERNTIILHHVMVGEVWLCSGQSNMEWTLGSGIDNKESEIANANHPLIHHIRIPKGSSDYPQENIEAGWEVCSPESVAGFSAVAYFFARELTEQLHIPIGLIHTSWGGSAAEAWTPKNIIEADPEYAQWRTLYPETYQWPYQPGSTYNAMIYPLAPYKIAGALWYQGESNTGNALVYRRLFPDMIKSWRDLWGYEFPFYYVQIAPFNYGRPLQGALVQEAQRLTLQASPSTGMAVTTDIGNVQDIHPKNKQDVGKRLALWALAKNYNKNIPYCGPLYNKIAREGNKIKVFFDHMEGGLELKDTKPDLYKIAGDNRQFVEAKVEVEKDGLLLSSELIPDPVAVRYAFTNVAEGNLYNKSGLPATPFRSDDWPVIYNNVSIKSVYDPAQQGFIISMEGDGSDKIVYSLDGNEPGLNSTIYEGPFVVKEKTNITAKGILQNQLSENSTTKDVLLSKATYRPLTVLTPSSEKYSKGGNYTLINGQKGNINNVNDPEWQGWEGDNMEVVVDLGVSQKAKKISIEFLQNQNAWVFLPSQVIISTSTNNRNFTDVLKQAEPTTNNRVPQTKNYTADINVNVRFVRIKAVNIGTCPPWHQGAGSKALILADEIMVE